MDTDYEFDYEYDKVESDDPYDYPAPETREPYDYSFVRHIPYTFPKYGEED